MRKTHFYVDISITGKFNVACFPKSYLHLYCTYGDDVAGRRSGVIIVNKFRTMFQFFCC